MWGGLVCAEVRLCKGVCWCVGVYGLIRVGSTYKVCTGGCVNKDVYGRAWTNIGVNGCVLANMGVYGFIWVCMGLYVCLCGGGV